jgi:transcription elongation factor Elf1
MSEKTKKILKSTLVVLIISTVIGLAIKNIGGDFITTFLLAFSCQYILFSFIGNVVNSYLTQQSIQRQLDNLEPLSTILQCSYCNQQNVMTFVPDESETFQFTCLKCEKKNSVKIQFVVARQTEILNLPVTSTGISFRDKEILDEEQKN